VKTIAKVLVLVVMGLAFLGAGIWACFAVNRYIGQGTDWKFLAAVMIPSACFGAAVWCAVKGWMITYEARRIDLLMRSAAAAGYSPKEITDYFK
jgi:hypothetical protein